VRARPGPGRGGTEGPHARLPQGGRDGPWHNTHSGPAAAASGPRWGRLLALLAGLGILAAAGFVLDLVVRAAATVPAMADPSHPLGASSALYDGSGKFVEYLPAVQQRQPVAIGDVPPLLQEAFIATEDRTFETNIGVSFRGIARAAIADVLHHGYVEGGSTISQQVARTLYLNQRDTLTRKLREAILAIELNRRYTKPQILDMYLNDVLLGPNIRGVEAAAQAYFDQTDLSKLSLPQMALLAGMPQAPSGYDPLAHPHAALLRRNEVLGFMEELHDITPAEYRQAVAAPLGVQAASPTASGAASTGYAYPWIVDAVIETLEQPPYNLSLDEIENGGLRIYTTFDPTLENDAVAAVQKHMNEIAPLHAGQPEMEAALVLMDQHNGDILALVGGREHTAALAFDRATANRRQPGSSIKPIVDYIPAMEDGLTMGTVVDDTIHAYVPAPGQPQYLPQDDGPPYYGLTTLTEAVRRSVNTVAVQVLNHIGIQRGIANADAMGLDLTSADAYLPVAIGGVSQKTCCSPLQMADAYAAIANGGMLVQPRLVTRVVGPDGTVLGTDPVQYKQVVDPRIAYVMTKVLETVMSPEPYDGWDSDWGTGYDAQVQDNVPGWPSAGKTGTTDNNTDLWFVGYTPLYTAAVWVGYDNQQVPVPQDAYGDTYAGPIWQQVMEDAVAGQAVVHFPRPSGVLEAPVDAKCAPWHVCSPSPLTPARWIQDDWFVAGTQPTPATSQNLWKQYQVTNTNPPELWNPSCGGTPVTAVYLDRTVLGPSWAQPIAYLKGTSDWQQFLPVDQDLAPPTASCTPKPAAAPAPPAAGGCGTPPVMAIAADGTLVPGQVCLLQGEAAVLRFSSPDGSAHAVLVDGLGAAGTVPPGGLLALPVTPAQPGDYVIEVDGTTAGVVVVERQGPGGPPGPPRA
jgi:penicillin-binding protein 1A